MVVAAGDTAHRPLRVPPSFVHCHSAVGHNRHVSRRTRTPEPQWRRRLSTGAVAEIVPDPYSPDGFELRVDGTAQSHVYREHPDELFFEYMQRIAHLIDAAAAAREPMTALHLGAGALSIPRYVAATRPGSRQQVVEFEPALVELVREALPLPRDASIRIRYGDARETLGHLPSGLRGHIDVIVVDVFSGARTPAHVTSAEFFEQLRGLLSPTGVVITNAADGDALRFVRSQAATLRYVFPHVLATAEPGVLKGRRFGNVVFQAGATSVDRARLARQMASGPFPTTVLADAELDRFSAGATVVTDAAAVMSPPPPKGLF